MLELDIVTMLEHPCVCQYYGTVAHFPPDGYPAVLLGVEVTFDKERHATWSCVRALCWEPAQCSASGVRERRSVLLWVDPALDMGTDLSLDLKMVIAADIAEVRYRDMFSRTAFSSPSESLEICPHLVALVIPPDWKSGCRLPA